MKRDGKFSVALHVLAHLAEAGDQPTTSEAMAAHLGTNPVVIRRTLAGLRKEGIVSSVKGHGGGWTVAKALSDVTLRQVYEILADPRELIPEPALGTHGCQIQAVVNDALNGFHAEANDLLLRRLEAYTLADLSTDLHHRLTKRSLDVTDLPLT